MKRNQQSSDGRFRLGDLGLDVPGLRIIFRIFNFIGKFEKKSLKNRQATQIGKSWPGGTRARKKCPTINSKP